MAVLAFGKRLIAAAKEARIDWDRFIEERAGSVVPHMEVWGLPKDDNG